MKLKYSNVYQFAYDTRFARYPILLPLYDIGLNHQGRPDVNISKGYFLYFRLFAIFVLSLIAWYCRISITNYNVKFIETFYGYYFAVILIISFICLLVIITTQNKLLDIFKNLNFVDIMMNERFELRFSYTLQTVLLYITVTSAYILFFIEVYISLVIYKRSVLDLIHMFMYLVVTIHRSFPMFFVTLIYIAVLKKLKAMNKIILNFNKSNQDCNVMVDDMNCLMECHRKLIESINLLFKIYGMSIAINLLTTTIPAATLLASVSMYSPTEVVEMYEFIGLNFVLVIPICCMAYQVIEEFKDIGRVLCEVDKSYTHAKLAEVKKLFLLLHDDINITAGGLFKIDGTLIPVLFAGIGSMALFIIQMVNVFSKK